MMYRRNNDMISKSGRGAGGEPLASGRAEFTNYNVTPAAEAPPSPYAAWRHRGASILPPDRAPHFRGRPAARFTRCGRILAHAAFAAMVVFAMPAFAQYRGPLSLEQCVAMALQSNLSLEMAAERLVERDAAIEEANVAKMPKVSANASYTYLIPGITGALTQKNPMADLLGPLAAMLPPGTIPPDATADIKVSSNVINAGVNANYVLYSGNRIQNAQKIAKQSREVSVWQQKSAVREVRRDVTKAFYQALAVNKSVEALDSAIALMETTIKDMNNLVEVGMLGEHEVLLMEVEVSNLRLGRQQAVTGAQAAHAYLAMLIGVPVNTPIELVNELHSPQSFAIPELTNLQARAKDVSADLKAMGKQLEIIETSIAITNAANLPTIVAAAGYSGSHQGRVIEPQKRDWEWGNTASVSLAAQWDIYDGNAKRHKVSQAKSQMRQLELGMETMSQGLDLQVKNSAASLNDAYAAIEVSRKSIAQAKRSFEISNDRFQEGMLASSELLRAQNSVLQSEIAYYNAISTFYGRQADLDFLVNE